MVGPIEEEFIFLRGLSKPKKNAGYDELYDIVNESYRRTGDIRDTMKKTVLSFGEVSDILLLKD